MWFDVQEIFKEKSCERSAEGAKEDREYLCMVMQVWQLWKDTPEKSCIGQANGGGVFQLKS